MKKVQKRFLGILLTLLMLLSLTACSSGNNASTTPSIGISPTGTPDAPSEGSSSPSPEATSHYPVTITTYDYSGEEIETVYEKAPEKVLAIYQGSIETMIALGLEDKITAAAGLDNEVDATMKSAFDQLNYLTEFTPSKETVLMLEPDLILTWGSIFSDKNLGDVSDWISKGSNTYINTNTRSGGSRTLENEFTDIMNLGTIFDIEEKAQALVDEMKNEIERVQTETAAIQQKPNVLILELTSNSITNYGSGTLGGDMVQSLGATLIQAEGKALGKETIISLDPEIIFVVYMAYSGDDPATVIDKKLNYILKDEAYASLQAVKNNRLIPIMLGDMYASGVRTKNGIINFAKGLYPELY